MNDLNITDVKKDLDKLVKKINSDSDFETLIGIRARAYLISKEIDKRKEAITKPSKEAIKEANAFFKEIESEYSEICSRIDPLLLEYRKLQKEKLNVNLSQLEGNKEMFEAQLDKGLVELKNKHVFDDSTIFFRANQEVVIENPEVVPKKYLSPDMKKIKEALAEGKKVKGVIIKDSETIVVRKK